MSNPRVKHALDQIKHGNILVKMIPSNIIDDNNNKSWHFNMKQFLDPGGYRPIKKIDKKLDRNQIWDAKQQKWEYRKTHSNRGHHKKTVFIKATPMTYPPLNGKMRYFSGGHRNLIGMGCTILNETHPEKIKAYLKLGFDELNKQHPELALIFVKDKYVFINNIGSNDKPWIYNTEKHGYSEISLDLISTTLPNIQEYIENLQKQNKIVPHNEVYCSPSYKSITFLFAANHLIDRLNLLGKHHFLKADYEIDLPLLLMDESTEVKEYEFSHQLDDLCELLKSEKNTDNREIINILLKQINFSQLLNDFTSINATLEQSIVDKICKLLLFLYTSTHCEKYNDFLQLISCKLNSCYLNECLYLAIKKNDDKNAKKFIELGASSSYINTEFYTLSLTIKKMNKAIFNLLIDQETETEVLQDALIKVSRLNNWSFSVYVAKKLFFKSSFNPNILTNGHSALYYAVKNKNIELIKLICINGGDAGQLQVSEEDPNLKISPLGKALLDAKKNNNYKIVETLIKYANKTLIPKFRGKCIEHLIIENQLDLVKSIINCNEPIEFTGYGEQLDKILTKISNFSMSIKSKQILALFFINKLFNETENPDDLMRHCRMLMKAEPGVKAFLFATNDANKTLMYHCWNDEPISSFFSHVIKLAKLRMLDILKHNDNLIISRELRDFITTQRRGINFFFKQPTSSKILDECDSKIWNEKLLRENEKTKMELRRTYGMSTSIK